MKKSHAITWQTFLVLIIGFIILFTSAFFILSAYWRLNRSHLTPVRISSDIVRIVKLAQTIQPDKLQTSQQYLRYPGIRTSITKIKPKGLLPLYDIDIKDIRAKVMKNPNNVRLTFPLTDQYYLHIRTHIVRTLSLKIQFFAALLVWLAALIGFCYYIVRRLSQPLAHFIEGANRFSQDINAPPLPETGPKSSRKAFQAFNRMQANLKQLIQTRTQMLAAISHDLRTPITRLQLRLENLSISDTTKKMQADLSQMETMIQSILNFSQNDYQHEPVANVDLNALCESICDDLQATKMPVTFKEANEKIICLGRAMALRRAITNLIANGIKYGKSVTVTLSSQGTFAKITITDKGPGIPEAELEQVFLPFYRVDKARQSNTGGSGLGLASARDIIRSHGGDIELKNLTAGGLSAVIRLQINSQ